MRRFRYLPLVVSALLAGFISGCSEYHAAPRQEMGTQPSAVSKPMVTVLDSGAAGTVLFGREADFDAALRAKNTDGNISVNNIGSMFAVKNGTHVEVVDRDDMLGKARIRVLEGDSAKEVGWVFTKWLKQIPMSSVSPKIRATTAANKHKTPEQMCDEYFAKLKEAGLGSVGPSGDSLLVTGVWVGDGGKVNVGVRKWFFDASRSQQRQYLRDLHRLWASTYWPSNDAFVEVDDDFGKGTIKVTHKRIIGL